MFDEKVVVPEQLPIQDRNRKSTDVCCTVIGAIFALTMFIVACCMWNQGKQQHIFRRLRSQLLWNMVHQWEWGGLQGWRSCLLRRPL